MSRFDAPRRVAIVGSGPAAMYLASHLLDRPEVPHQIDIFERLPAPWGLVRWAVAPDHPEKKLVIDRLFSYTFDRPELRFFGNVEIGSDITHQELRANYDGVFYACGADGDNRMGIPGEDLPGSWSAREFVAWYSGHPDFSHLTFDLSHPRAVIVGNGNVALDVARILTSPVAELAKTDIADHALTALSRSQITEVVILGRRAAAQGAFNNPELEELAHIPGVLVEVDWGADQSADAELSWAAQRKLTTLKDFSSKAWSPSAKKIVLKFLSSPVGLIGDGRVSQICLAANQLQTDASGRVSARASDQHTLLETGLVMRAIGYRGRPFAGLPFDNKRGVIENRQGRVCANGETIPGVYVCGWIKRGAQGVIGSNKKCAAETVGRYLEDIADGATQILNASLEAIPHLLDKRGIRYVSKSDWARIDRFERNAGRATGRPRVKLTTSDALLEATL